MIEVCDRCGESTIAGLVTVSNSACETFVLRVHEAFCEIPGDLRVYWSERLARHVTIPE